MERVEQLLAREQERFEATHPRSRAIHEEAGEDLLSGVPMNWMTRWPGSFPVFVDRARGGRGRPTSTATPTSTSVSATRGR